MSVLKLIAAHIDLQSDALKNLSEDEIIRIEKYLKAEVNLNQSLTLNEVDLILRMLRNYRRELEILAGSSLDNLRKILECTDQFFVDNDALVLAIHPDENIAEFILKFFGKDLSDYVSRCMKHEHYNGLNTLLVYSELLPVVLLDDISKKCLHKIEYATECISIGASGLKDKIDILTNPFFYRSLNKLGSMQFQTALIDFYNALINVSHVGFELNAKGLYAIGFFKTSHSRFREALADAQQGAFNKGAREIHYKKGEVNNKGGTYIFVEALDPEVVRQREENAELVRKHARATSRTHFSPKPKYHIQAENGTDKTYSIFQVLGGIVVLFFVVIVFKMSDLPNSRSNDDLFEFDMPEIPEMSLDPSFFEPASIDVEYEDTVMFALNGQAVYHQSADLKITKERNIDFDIDKTNLQSRYESYSDGRLTFVNQTERPVIILFSGLYNLFLDVGESDSTHWTDRFCVYTGSEPQMITYKDSTDETRKDFRFKNFTAEDNRTLHKIYKCNRLTFGKYTIRIAESSGRIQVLLRDDSMDSIF